MTRCATAGSRPRVRVAPTSILLACALAIGTATLLFPAAAGAATKDVYALANTCVQITDRTGTQVGGRSAPFTAKAAGLGSYLFSGRDGRLLTASAVGAPTLVVGATPRAQWNVTGSGRDFTLRPAVSDSGGAHNVRLTPATGCRAFPEPEIDVSGPVMRGTDPQGNLRGFVDSHAHLLSEQFLGGELHCGKPFDPLGVTVALRDCPDHDPEGIPAVSEQVLSRPGPHATDGWPTLSQWPRWDSLTHEQTYYRWIERSWRSGLRMIQNYYVQNRVLCEKYWRGDQPCDEMESVRIQHKLLHQLVDYIDAQNSGPGKGFLRIVSSAADARRVIAAGRPYPGVISSHTWTDPHNYRRILDAGGIVGLFATPAEARPGEKGRHGDLPPDFLSAWRVLRAQRSPDHFFGVGFGPDMGGLGAQAQPRPSAARNPVRYPFRGADGVTAISRQVSGQRVFDVNVDGTAHYGLLPDWIESLRIEAGPVDGPRVVGDLFAAAEAYTRMWERVEAYRG